MDYLGVGNLVGGLAGLGASIADPYFYTKQEQAKDGLTGQQLAAQQASIDAQLLIAQEREQTNQKAITYGLAAVLGVSGIYLASRLIGK